MLNMAASYYIFIPNNTIITDDAVIDNTCVVPVNCLSVEKNHHQVTAPDNRKMIKQNV